MFEYYSFDSLEERSVRELLKSAWTPLLLSEHPVNFRFRRSDHGRVFYVVFVVEPDKAQSQRPLSSLGI